MCVYILFNIWSSHKCTLIILSIRTRRIIIVTTRGYEIAAEINRRCRCSKSVGPRLYYIGRYVI